MSGNPVHGKKFGLLNTAGVKGSMSQATRKLKFEVDGL